MFPLVLVIAVLQYPTLKGDAQLYAVLRDAAIKSARDFPRGSMRVLTSVRLPNPEFDVDIESTIWWNGDRVRIESVRNYSREARERNRRLAPASSSTIIMNGGQNVTYNPESWYLAIHAGQNGRASWMPGQPRAMWFGPDESLPWSTWFGPDSDSAHGHGRNLVLGYKVEQIDRDKVKSEVSLRDGYKHTMICSFRLGGNVIESIQENTDVGPGELIRLVYKYSWAPDPSGRVVLKEMERVSEALSGSSKVERSQIRHIFRDVTFDQPEEDRFDVNRLTSLPGILVRDGIKGKLYRSGDSDPRDFRPSLEELAAQVRARGFAAPLRESRR